MRDITYPPIIVTAKVLFRAVGLRFQMSGTEHVPRHGGALLAINHIGYVDFVLAGYAAQPSGRLVRFMAKKEVFEHGVAGPLMRSLHHIPVDRSDGIGSFHEAVSYLRSGEVVGIFPEATISRSFEVKDIKTGAVRIAAEAGVPLLPVALWGTQRLMTKDHPRDLTGRKTIGIRVGAPMDPSGDANERTEELRRRMQAQVDEAVAEYPADEQPAGSWWLPARLGGSAPTPEEAKRLDSEELRARLRRKRETSATQRKRQTDK